MGGGRGGVLNVAEALATPALVLASSVMRFSFEVGVNAKEAEQAGGFWLQPAQFAVDGLS